MLWLAIMIIGFNCNNSQSNEFNFGIYLRKMDFEKVTRGNACASPSLNTPMLEVRLPTELHF